MKPLPRAAKFACHGNQRGSIHQKREAFERKSFPPDRSLLHGIAAALKKVVMKIDLHGACLRACATKRRGVGEMLPILKPAEMRRDHGTNRTLIRCPIAMAADVAIDRADIQACAAADAMKGIPLLAVGEEVGSLVVQEHQMEFFGSVGFAWLARTAVERVIARQRLPCAGGGKHGQEECEILKLRKDFLAPRCREWVSAMILF